MENNRFKRLQKTTGLHMEMEVKECLRQVTEFPDSPDAMKYFYDLFARVYSKTPLLSNNDKPMIAFMCVQVPGELIQAAGAVGVRLCSGFHAYDQVGADFMPSKSCPVVKATLGMLYVHKELFADTLKTIIIPTTCDQKKKAGELLRTMGFEVITLEMPSCKDSNASRFYWQESIKQLTLDLQKITNHKITSKGVKRAINLTGRASAVFRRLYELRSENPALFLGKDAFLVSNAYFFDDPENWIKAVSKLVEELQHRKENGFRTGSKNSPRLLFTGSAPIFPNLKVPLLVEQSGAIIVADEVCSSQRLLYDSPTYDEGNLNDLIPAIADRYLKPCTCPCLSNNHDRLRKLKEMAELFKVDGIIYQTLSGCLPYDMEQQQVYSIMNEKNIPMLSLETDYSPEDLGQLSTRIEAFIESIKAKRRKNNEFSGRY
jgi:benzoyl-CoA reductase/2-hydroxyglutaryl-CoA dehydratase subunit BcrC/BadD/HgdB